MNELDIRTEETSNINFIRIADWDDDYYLLEGIRKTDLGFEFYDTDGVDCDSVVMSKDQALNLIKAIEKAIELGWVE